MTSSRPTTFTVSRLAVGIAVVSLLAAVASCSSETASRSAAAPDAECLTGGNWTQANRDALNELITKHAGQNRSAIFDWDNTSAARDVGAAGFAQLVVNGDLAPGKVPAAFMPAFTQGGVTYDSNDVSAYKSGLAKYTNDTKTDTDYPGNVWPSQIYGMIGKTVAEASAVVGDAYANGSGSQDVGTGNLTKVGTGPYAQPRPFLYPEMIDLYGCLITNGFDVRVASASPTWAVRTIVREALNPALAAKFGHDVAVPAPNVMGISWMLKDKQTGQLVNDSVLVRSSSPEGVAYAAGDPAALRRYLITTLPSGIPVDDAGKPANVLEWVTPDIPVLVAGDSNGDLANLTRAENRLWVARLTSPDLAESVVPIHRNSPDGWIVQPTLYLEDPGFISSRSDLDERLPLLPATALPQIDQSINTLTKAGMLSGFSPPTPK